MLHHLLQSTLAEEPERKVLEFQGRFWTARELDQSARSLAAGLMAAGAESGDRVAVLLPNCRETVLAYLACFKANFVMVPLDYRHRATQIGYALSHSGASVLIVHHDRVAELAAEGALAGIPTVLIVGGDATDRRHRRFDDVASRSAPSSLPESFEDQDLCIMIFTSGTTSRPKGVTLTRGAVQSGITKYLARVPLGPKDHALIAAPITRPMALRCQLLPVLYAGGCVSLVEQFGVEPFVAAFRRAPAKTYLTLLPSALAQVLANPEFAKSDFSALRLCVAGGDRVPTRLQEEFAALTGVPVTEQCGASEVGPYAMNPPFGRKKPGSIGLPMYGTQVCVVNEQGADVRASETGEILVRSPMMMEGYWNDTALTRKVMRDGWVRTGDLGRFDEDGFLWFMGRKKDVIVRGGSNVSPLEVEFALSDHPDVAESCVIGVPDAEWGQVVHACVVLRPGGKATAEELRESLKGRLAAYMVPEQIHLMDQMPVKGPGKIDRELLRMRAIIHPLIEKVPFFRSASADFIRDIVPRLESREFEANEVVFRQGEPGDAMYFLTSGQVSVTQEDAGRQVAVLREGMYFGEVAILKEVPRTATIRAITDCEVYQLKRGDVLGLTQTYPEFARHIQEALEHYERS
ncbi:MAG: AMP-binding protein [Verrucomicrobiales bacterium]|nr:AMP-binding protein [Verrucomicrobiales bacterium]